MIKRILILFLVAITSNVMSQENPPILKLQKTALITPSTEDLAVVTQPLILGEGYGYGDSQNAQGFVQIIAPLTDRMFSLEGTILRFSGGFQETIKFQISAYGYTSGSTPAVNFGANPPKAYWQKQINDLPKIPVVVGNISENGILKTVITIGSASTIWGKYFNIIVDKVYLTNNGIPVEIINTSNWQISKSGQVNSLGNYQTNFVNNSSFGYISAKGTTSTVMATNEGDIANLEVTNDITDGNLNKPAFMQFHRKGLYAAYFGLDNDNQFKVGGWSMGNIAYKLWHEGNFNPLNKVEVDGSNINLTSFRNVLGLGTAAFQNESRFMTSRGVGGSAINANNYLGSSSIHYYDSGNYGGNGINFPYSNAYGTIATFDGLSESGLSFQFYSNTVSGGGGNSNELFFRTATNSWRKVAFVDQLGSVFNEGLNNGSQIADVNNFGLGVYKYHPNWVTSNSPDGYFGIVTTKSGQGWKFQDAKSANGNTLSRYQIDGGVWTPWITLLNTSNFNALNGIPIGGESLQSISARGNTFLDPANPNNKFIGVGKQMTDGDAAFIGWRYNNGNSYGYVETYGGGKPIVLQRGNPGKVFIGNTEDVGNGTKFQVSGNAYIRDNLLIGNVVDNNTDKLQVNGSIKSKEVKVQPSGWPDYVFEPTYKLITLSETEKYIKEYKHLPEIPSEKEINEIGLSLGEMNALLLKKIEELTLHLINQDKKIIQLSKDIENIKAN